MVVDMWITNTPQRLDRTYEELKLSLKSLALGGLVRLDRTYEELKQQKEKPAIGGLTQFGSYL